MENEFEKFVAEAERSPDLAAVTRYHLDELMRAMDRCSDRSRAKVFEVLSSRWCRDCGDRCLPCPCTNDE